MGRGNSLNYLLSKRNIFATIFGKDESLSQYGEKTTISDNIKLQYQLNVLTFFQYLFDMSLVNLIRKYFWISGDTNFKIFLSKRVYNGYIF